MIEITDEMERAFAKAHNEALRTPRREGYAVHDGLAAVLAIVERDLRHQLADAIDARIRMLRGKPFRSGEVGIEFINGIEDAGSFVETGQWS